MLRLYKCGTDGNRTSDTRIFSPLLYQLSYGTSVSLILSECGCKNTTKFLIDKKKSSKIVFFLFFQLFFVDIQLNNKFYS